MIMHEVETIPELLEPDVLYVSRKYATASHLCACGCGTEVVTPLGLRGWRVIPGARGVTVMPSIGNWSFPCRSHYIICNGYIQWAAQFTPDMVEAARRADNPRAYEPSWAGFLTWLRGILSTLGNLFR